jgi:hypothetical protein
MVAHQEDTMTDEHETTRETPEMTAYSVDTQPLPSPWQSVVSAFRQVRLVRLEARVRQLRRGGLQRPDATAQQLLVVPANDDARPHTHCMSVPARRRWRTVAVVTVMIIGGITARVLSSRNPLIAVADVSDSLMERQHTPPAAPSPDATRLTTLEERLVVLSQQVERLDNQLRTQSAVLVSVTQQTDTDTAHLTTLADTLTAMSEQVQQLAQQVTSQAPRVAAHEQQLAIHTAQLGVLRAGALTPVVNAAPRRRPGPPTLEVLAPQQVSPVVTNSRAAVPESPIEAQAPRRTITLPASLGVVGFRREPTREGGPQP